MITISGNEVPIVKNSLRIRGVVEERSIASFGVGNSSSEYIKGQPVLIYDDDSDLIYAGVVEQSQKIRAGASFIHDITCLDWHYLTDKRIIAKSYEAELAGYIVSDIITSYLAAEGITVGEIQDGPVIAEAVFNYIYITQALDSLAEKTGFTWYIDEAKALYFIDRSTNAAPFTLTESDCEKGSISVEKGNPKYRNRQYIKGVRDITDPYSEKHLGDGKARSWTVPFPIAKEPTIKINGTAVAAADIGIRGIETEKKYYWSKNDKIVNQDAAETVLSSSDEIEIISEGYFDIVALTYNPDAIDALKLIEGAGTGYVEAVDDEPATTTRDSAFQIANQRLEKYGTIDHRIKAKTTRKGLKPGQLLPVSFTDYGVSVNALIESVVIERIDNIYYYNITAVEGPVYGSWAKLFYKIATSRLDFTIRENIGEDEMLTLLQTFSKTWIEATSNNIFKEIYAADTLFPSDTLFPMFETEDRVKYLELLDGTDQVIIRKPITKQTGADTDEIESIVMLLSFEANVTIAKVRWYGGTFATTTNGSGILVDEQVYAHEKTQFEVIQMAKTDTRNFVPMTGTKALTVAYWQGVDDDVEAYLAHSA